MEIGSEFLSTKKINSTSDSELHPLDEQLLAGIRGDLDRGAELAEQLARVSPHCHRAAFNRAWYEMRKGDLLSGLRLLDRGRWEGVFGDKPLPTNKPIYRNEDLDGKHLILCSEGGLGDEIINVRFAQDFAARGAKVIVTTDPHLTTVFARVPGVSAVVRHKAAPEVHHDFWVPAMSAAHILNYNYQMLKGQPYISVDPIYRQKWSEYFSTRYPNPEQRPRIALRFFGNPEFEHEQHRRFPVSGLIRAVGDRPWVSLQLEQTPLPIKNWEDTLAIIDQMDLVISSCTSVAHAAAAMGKETWVIVPVLPYYLWALPGDRSPWYRSVQLFRQKQYGTWDNVFEEIHLALEGWEKNDR